MQTTACHKAQPMDQAMPIDFGSCLVFWVETIPWSDSIGKHVLRSWCFLCRSVVLFKSSQKHVARGNLRSNDKTLWASMGTVAGHLLSTSLSIQLFLTHTVWYQVMLHHFGYAWGILTSKRSWTNTLSATQQKNNQWIRCVSVIPVPGGSVSTRSSWPWSGRWE
jgi:hypothetical protein